MIFRQNEIRDELVNLANRALTPSAVLNEPLIHGCANESMKTLPTKLTNQNIDNGTATGEDERGVLLIRGFWTAVTNCHRHGHVSLSPLASMTIVESRMPYLTV